MYNVLLCLVGESGSGKTTIADALANKYNLKVLKSYTTRPPRENDDSHILISDEEFAHLTDIVAYVEYNGYKYCATKEQLNNSDIYVIDPDGLNMLRDKYKDKLILDYYVSVSEEERMRRMQNRGDSESAINARIELDKKVFANCNTTFTISNEYEQDFTDTIDFLYQSACLFDAYFLPDPEEIV